MVELIKTDIGCVTWQYLFYSKKRKNVANMVIEKEVKTIKVRELKSTTVMCGDKYCTICQYKEEKFYGQPPECKHFKVKLEENKYNSDCIIRCLQCLKEGR